MKKIVNQTPTYTKNKIDAKLLLIIMSSRVTRMNRIKYGQRYKLILRSCANDNDGIRNAARNMNSMSTYAIIKSKRNAGVAQNV